MSLIYSEEQVNTYTNSSQFEPEVAALTGGGYVVVWTSDTQDNADGSYGIYAQRYTASGVAIGLRMAAISGAPMNCKGTMTVP